MIRAIVAIDSKFGLANNKGIPWDLPTDKKYFRAKVEHQAVLMGYKTYQEFTAPLSDKQNYVASKSKKDVKKGFKLVSDANKFLKDFKNDIWIIGGASLYASTIDLVDELYITQLEGEFNCTKFFPAFKNDFKLDIKTKPQQENGITYTFQIWKHKQQR